MSDFSTTQHRPINLIFIDEYVPISFQCWEVELMAYTDYIKSRDWLLARKIFKESKEEL